MARKPKYDWKEIKKHYEAGKNQSEIVLEFGCAKSSLSERIKKWNNGEIFIDNKESMVYIIQMGDFNIYKIGIADNPVKRIKQLQTGNPYKLKLVDSFYKWNARQVELRIHKRYNKYKMEGEWFKLSKKQIETLKRNRK